MTPFVLEMSFISKASIPSTYMERDSGKKVVYISNGYYTVYSYHMTGTGYY